ncbi:hypothetical protein [Paenibacillus aceris]|uniref:Uncharacterized protein n=1 Tax=Paenibacillus aceris TaxID=869555 RepID=A0ABS4HVC0_9BACL|nr:hypothetical protein [Paenibacillus aceris]MBP1962166.1 hypothetical protein [Paenibacillus aceris]NHW33986.1 hypothetical protein [Paenibacillus aceris]
MQRKSNKKSSYSNGKTKVRVRQSASATIGQGGNSISVNASEVGVVRIRP